MRRSFASGAATTAAARNRATCSRLTLDIQTHDLFRIALLDAYDGGPPASNHHCPADLPLFGLPSRHAPRHYGHTIRAVSPIIAAGRALLGVETLSRAAQGVAPRKEVGENLPRTGECMPMAATPSVHRCGLCPRPLET